MATKTNLSSVDISSYDAIDKAYDKLDGENEVDLKLDHVKKAVKHYIERCVTAKKSLKSVNNNFLTPFTEEFKNRSAYRKESDANESAKQSVNALASALWDASYSHDDLYIINHNTHMLTSNQRKLNKILNYIESEEFLASDDQAKKTLLDGYVDELKVCDDINKIADTAHSMEVHLVDNGAKIMEKAYEIAGRALTIHELSLADPNFPDLSEEKRNEIDEVLNAIDKAFYGDKENNLLVSSANENTYTKVGFKALTKDELTYWVRRLNQLNVQIPVFNEKSNWEKNVARVLELNGGKNVTAISKPEEGKKDAVAELVDHLRNVSKQKQNEESKKTALVIAEKQPNQQYKDAVVKTINEVTFDSNFNETTFEYVVNTCDTYYTLDNYSSVADSVEISESDMAKVSTLINDENLFDAQHGVYTYGEVKQDIESAKENTQKEVKAIVDADPFYYNFVENLSENYLPGEVNSLLGEEKTDENLNSQTAEQNVVVDNENLDKELNKINADRNDAAAEGQDTLNNRRKNIKKRSKNKNTNKQTENSTANGDKQDNVAENNDEPQVEVENGEYKPKKRGLFRRIAEWAMAHPWSGPLAVFGASIGMMYATHSINVTTLTAMAGATVLAGAEIAKVASSRYKNFMRSRKARRSYKKATKEINKINANVKTAQALLDKNRRTVKSDVATASVNEVKKSKSIVNSNARHRHNAAKHINMIRSIREKQIKSNDTDKHINKLVAEEEYNLNQLRNMMTKLGDKGTVKYFEDVKKINEQNIVKQKQEMKDIKKEEKAVNAEYRKALKQFNKEEKERRIKEAEERAKATPVDPEREKVESYVDNLEVSFISNLPTLDRTDPLKSGNKKFYNNHKEYLEEEGFTEEIFNNITDRDQFATALRAVANGKNPSDALRELEENRKLAEERARAIEEAERAERENAEKAKAARSKKAKSNDDELTR